MPAELPEERESLFLLAAPPLIWLGHLMLSYVTAAIWCAKVAGGGGSLAPARIAIAVYTMLALGLVVGIGARARTRHRLPGGTGSHDTDTPEDRHRFLGLATLLLAGLSAIGIVYVSLSAVFIGGCR